LVLDDQQMLSSRRRPAEPNRRRIVNLDEGGGPAMNGSNPPLWERPVRWPADGLPFDMRALRYVLAAAEQMSFSGAASALGVKVSSISRHVRDFEDDLGISLFERTSAGVRLTDAGSRFLDDIVPVLQMAEVVRQRASAAGRVEEGTVRIGIITTLAGGFLRDLIASYRRCFLGSGPIDLRLAI
jgi:hypothetical protein